MRRCKVVATYFGDRQHRPSSSYPRHCQHQMTAADCLEMSRALIVPEEGVQLIVINNDSGYEPGREFLESLRSDAVIVDHRANIGGGFGAFAYAFEAYRDRFDWWLFCEDDFRIIPSYDELVARFAAEENCGFLALIGVYGRDPIHAHGGIGLTSGAILDQVAAANGGSLPYPNCRWLREKIEVEGEVRFTNEIAKLGYRLVPFGSNESHDTAIPWVDVVKAAQ